MSQKFSNKKFPFILAHRGGCGHGRENSLAAVQASLAYAPDIIELDVRRSRDGVLYCFHGSGLLGHFGAQFLRYFLFSTITRLVAPARLTEIVALIPSETDFYLDIKQENIIATEIKTSLLLRHSKQIWIAPYTLSHLRRLRAELSPDYIYVLNRPYLCLKNVMAAQGIADVVQLWWWQCRQDVLESLRNRGIAWYMSNWLIRPKKVLKEAVQAQSVFMSLDELSGVRDKIKQLIDETT